MTSEEYYNREYEARVHTVSTIKSNNKLMAELYKMEILDQFLVNLDNQSLDEYWCNDVDDPINAAFDWQETPEGGPFWEDVRHSISW